MARDGEGPTAPQAAVAFSFLQIYDWEVDCVQRRYGSGDAVTGGDSGGRERERERCGWEEDGAEELHAVNPFFF